MDSSYARALGEVLDTVHSQIRRCQTCGNYTSVAADDEIARCAICRDDRRDAALVCAVARVQDLLAIERSGSFRGRYHVLHGLLAPLDGVGPDRLPLTELLARIEREGIEEVVVATPLSVEGEATALYVAQVVRPRGVKVSRIASGIPHGGELEFADQVTLGRAFDGRREL
jgi:recombination protein RecR